MPSGTPLPAAVLKDTLNRMRLARYAFYRCPSHPGFFDLYLDATPGEMIAFIRLALLVLGARGGTDSQEERLLDPADTGPYDHRRRRYRFTAVCPADEATWF